MRQQMSMIDLRIESINVGIAGRTLLKDDDPCPNLASRRGWKSGREIRPSISEWLDPFARVCKDRRKAE